MRCSRAGTKPARAAEGARTRSGVSRAAAPTSARRCAAASAGRSRAPVAAPISATSPWNVWTDPPRTAPLAAHRSRSKRAASSAVGTTRTGSRASEPTKRARASPARPELGGPTISDRDIVPSIGRGSAAIDDSARAGAVVPSGDGSIFAAMSLCFIDPADAIRAIADSIGREARRQLLGEAVRAWVDEIPDDELEAHYARAIAELDDHDISMLAAWHASMEVGHPLPNRDFLMGAFTSLGQHRREALKLAAGFRGEEAVDRGVTEERALETVLDWLSPRRLMELAAEAVELYVWDRAGADN